MSSVFLLSSDYYDEAGHISIHATSPTGLVFAKVPIQFLRKGGLNTWDFVLAITNMLVDPVPSCPGTIRTTTGNPIDITSVPTDGDYVYIQEGSMMPIKYSRGPDYKSQRRPAGSDQDSLSSSSDGSSNASQAKFRRLRRLLEKRDFNCLIKNTRSGFCDAAHIVPKTKPEVYQKILGYGVPSLAPVYRASSGLLLNMISHRSFDALEWSIYPQDGLYYVHFFVRTEFSELHGKVINRDRFRFDSEDELPNPKLLAWHYAQCVRGHIRGFPAQYPTITEQAEALRVDALAALERES